MRSLSLIRGEQCLRACGILLLAWCTVASPSRAQDAVLDTFEERLERAAQDDDAAALAALVEQNRLGVKPVVLDLISASLQAELAGDAAKAADNHVAATRIAAAFEDRFGERSLGEAVSYVDGWSREQKRAKLEADSLYEIATEQRSTAETREDALRNYVKGLKTYRSIGDRVGAATTLGGIGFVYWYLGNVDSTLAYIEAGLEARRDVDDRQLLGNSLNDMGSASRAFLRDNDAALDYYRRAAAVRDEIGDLDGLAKTYSYMGVVTQDVGDAREAVGFLDRAATLALTVGDTARATASLLQSGMALADLGEHTEALARFEQSLELRPADDPGRANVLSQIGVVYRRLGDYDAALQKYQEVIQWAEAVADSTLLAAGLSNAGIVLQWAERFELAARYYERALSIFEDLDDLGGKLSPLINLASVYQDLEQFDRSEPNALEALTLSRELRDPLREASALILLGNLYNLTDRDDRGLTYYEEGLDLARDIENPELEWAALMGFGERLEREGEYEDAVGFYEDALAKIEGVRGGLQFGDDKAKFLAQKRFAYENVVHVLSLLHEKNPTGGYDHRAFRIAERGKARAFLDLLSEAVTKEETKLPPALLEKQNSLIGEIGATQRLLQHEMAESGTDADSTDALQNKLDDLEEAYQKLQREIRRENPAYVALSSPDVASLEDVQQNLLDEHSVLLQYAVGDSSSSLWAVSKDAVRMYRLPARDVLQEQVEILRFALTNPDQAADEAFSTSARRLYRDLIMPAEDLIDGTRELVIIPDDVLHYVPFDALLTDEPQGRPPPALPYLVRTHATSYGHSASVLLQLANERDHARRPHEKQLLAFGDPDFGLFEDENAVVGPVADVRAGLSRLPFSGDEVRAIRDLFTDANADIYLREEAAEEMLKAEGLLQRYKYLHFATHGIVDERRPDFSGIVLAQNDDSDEDGFLQAAEIFDLEINADLVVLSACETGLGEMVRGEGLVGLTRAFMYAGAPSILVSLWKVSDASTSTLMGRFYESMIDDGLSTSGALQQAKIQMLSKDSTAHPFYWAPFVITGNRN